MSDPKRSPSQDQISSILQAIADGSADPYDSARHLWTDFWSEDPDRYRMLTTFVNDATDYEELLDRRTEIAQHIVDESRRILRSWST